MAAIAGADLAEGILGELIDLLHRGAPAEDFAALLARAEDLPHGVPGRSGLAERIRIALANTPFKNSKSGVNYGPITLSIGVCQASAAEDPVDLYNKSDVALYCAKNAGRNRCMLFEEGMKKDAGKSWLIYRK